MTVAPNSKLPPSPTPLHPVATQAQAPTKANTPRASFESLKKVDLEAALDRYLTQHASAFASDPKVAGFFASQAKARGSPVKRESVDDAGRPLRVAKRRTTRAPDSPG